MTRFIPISIKKEGLKNYLNRTIDEHDSYGYTHFVRELEKGQNPTSLARMFNVSRNTIYKWRKIYKAEKNKAEADIEDLRDV